LSARRRRLAALVPVLAASLTLAACEGEVSIGDSTVAADDIASEASSALAKKVGQAPKSVSCPDDLDVEVGQSETCTLTANDGSTYDMTAKITSVDGETANFDFQVGDKQK